jgi:hypothetical protein
MDCLVEQFFRSACPTLLRTTTSFLTPFHIGTILRIAATKKWLPSPQALFLELSLGIINAMALITPASQPLS